jgi:glycosyltransferase involved in cell wall biosynthesis
MPRVTVVVPCFNNGRTVEETVDSAVAQTFKDLEIVVVDDGSTDPFTAERLAAFRSERTRVVRTENGGPGHARNLGISQGSGEYVLPLDADDLIAPTYVEKAVRVLDSNPRIGIVYCRASYIGARSGPWELPDFALPDALWDNCIFVSSLFRRSEWKAVGGFDDRRENKWEDWDFWLALIERGALVHRIPEDLFRYRIAETSRNAELNANRAALDAAFSHLMRSHRRLYAKHVRSLFERREKLERREGAAALVALTAMTQPRPASTYVARLSAAVRLLAWSSLAHTRR